MSEAIESRGHDKDCPGCATDRRMHQPGGGFVRDYLAHCDACGDYIQGDTEHKVSGKTYHRRCVPPAPATR